ncbi:AMP-binding enzyme [Rhizobium beringeri]
MIEIKGPNVFKGYWRMPEKTAAEFTADGFFISGDLGKIDGDGYVHIVGRGKDLVISGGYNIYPKEVEGEIDQIEGVVESAVIGLPHSDFGEGVTAIVVRKPGAVLDEKAIVSALQDRLARYKQPKRIIFVEDLPRNTMGKVQKNILRQQYADLYTKTEGDCALWEKGASTPRTNLEHNNCGASGVEGGIMSIELLSVASLVRVLSIATIQPANKGEQTRENAGVTTC